MKKRKEKALDKWFYVYSEPIFDTMKDIKYNEETKLYLNMKQRKCRKVLADFFGSDRLRNIKVDSVFYDISDIFIDYITKKQDLMDYEDYLKYIEMFESLTGIDESSIIEESDDPLEMYEKKFSWEIKHAKDKLMKIFADIYKRFYYSIYFRREKR